MRIRVQQKGHELGPIVDIAAVPRRGDVITMKDADRTVDAVDWNTGADREFAATVWVV